MKSDRENRSEKKTFHAQSEFTIPEETVRIARAVSPRGSTLLKIRDEPGTLSQDQAFAELFPRNSWKSFPIGKLPKPFAVALTGNSCWGWNWLSLALMKAGSLNFANA